MINKKMYHNLFLKYILATIINMGISSSHAAAPAQGLELSKLQSPKDIVGEKADTVLSILGLRNLVAGYIGNWDIEKFKAYDGHHIACTPSFDGEDIFVIMSQVADAKTKKEKGEKVDIVRYETVSGRCTKILTAHRPYTKIKCMPDGRLVAYNDTHAALYTPQGTLIKNLDIAGKKLKMVGNKVLIMPDNKRTGYTESQKIEVVESDNSVRELRFSRPVNPEKIFDVRGSEILSCSNLWGLRHSMQFDDSSILQVGATNLDVEHINTRNNRALQIFTIGGSLISHMQKYEQGIISVDEGGLVRLWRREDGTVDRGDLNPELGQVPCFTPRKYRIAHRVGANNFVRYVACFNPTVTIMNFEGSAVKEIGKGTMEGSLGLIKVKPTSQGYVVHDAAGLFWCHEKNHIQRAYENPAKRVASPDSRSSCGCPLM